MNGKPLLQRCKTPREPRLPSPKKIRSEKAKIRRYHSISKTFSLSMRLMILAISLVQSQRRPAYAHDCIWLVQQFSVEECWLSPGSSPVLSCRKNPAEDYFCSATRYSFPGNGTYFEASISCSFPGYREDGCEYALALYGEARSGWLAEDGHHCTDNCVENEQKSDIVIVALGASIGALVLIVFVVYMVRRIRSESVTSYSPRSDLEASLSADENKREQEPEDGGERSK
jgi:hypothetical protein